MRTVGDLIEALKQFDPRKPVVYRHTEQKGGYTDWTLHLPAEFFLEVKFVYPLLNL